MQLKTHIITISLTGFQFNTGIPIAANLFKPTFCSFRLSVEIWIPAVPHSRVTQTTATWDRLQPTPPEAL